jgi:hypothetical protein
MAGYDIGASLSGSSSAAASNASAFSVIGGGGKTSATSNTLIWVAAIAAGAFLLWTFIRRK